MSVVHKEGSGDMSILRDKRIGIIGYGNLGRPIALNLRDSGLQVAIGVNDEEHYNRVRADGLVAASITQVAQECPILLLLLPDEVMPQVYLHKISPFLQRGYTLIFANGYNIAYNFIEPPSFVDVGVIAPRTFGEAVRERYLNGTGFYSFVASGQDASGQIWPTILGLADAMGSLKAGAVEITIEQEVHLDLFVQQAILPVMHHVMLTAANLLLNLGYPPEATLMDLYISGEFTDYLAEAGSSGLLHALRRTSLTAQYGIFSRLERFNDLKLERLMEITLDEIRQGSFSKEWAREYADGYPRLRRLLTQQQQNDLWELERDTIEAIRET